MRTKILTFAMLFTVSTFSIQMNAQLEVLTSGDVKAFRSMEVQNNIMVNSKMAIGTTISDYIALNIKKMGMGSSAPIYGVKSIVQMPTYPLYTLYGMYGEANALNATGVQYPYPVVGVYGTFKKAEGISTFAAGVAGIAHYRGGIGVFGGINSPITSLPADAKYAGYFKGTTKVDGTFLANLIVLNSDTLRVNNIQNLPRNTTSSIIQLRPVSYTFKPDSTWQYDEKMQREMEGMHYGFVAQDVQKIFPELVYEREGNLSVNYIEMIPLLVQTIQKLSAEVKELKSDLIHSKKIKSNSNDNIEKAALGQNTPNPFSQTTTISYYLPNDTHEAAIHIYDMNGMEISANQLITLGHGELNIKGGTLRAGIYLYSLVADGQLVDTKQMILTK